MRRTNNQTRQIHNIPPNREAERARHRGARRLQQYTMRVHRLRRVLKRVVREVLPVLDDRLVLEQLEDVTNDISDVTPDRNVRLKLTS